MVAFPSCRTVELIANGGDRCSWGGLEGGEVGIGGGGAPCVLGERTGGWEDAGLIVGMVVSSGVLL